MVGETALRARTARRTRRRDAALAVANDCLAELSPRRISLTGLVSKMTPIELILSACYFSKRAFRYWTIHHMKKTMRSILKRYLVDYHNFENVSPLHKRGVARFLLNDVVRYWRTVAVDYQAKRWDELSPPAGAFQEDDGLGLEPPKWGLRYIKLRSSRKLAFVGSLVSLHGSSTVTVLIPDDAIDGLASDSDHETTTTRAARTWPINGAVLADHVKGDHA